MKDTLEILVQKANKGDSKSLELVVLTVKDFVFNLSLKMLLFREDAEDATQEILIKIITRLSTFNYESKFKTWVYRVSTNYLLSHKGKLSTKNAMPFEDYATLIDTGQSNTVRYSKNEGELSLLEEEVKVSCTQGLLLCLENEDRMVYILSEILAFNSQQGSEILQIKPENYRKKLSRSRVKIRNFLQNKCGLVNSKNPCRCTKKIDFLIDEKIVNPKDLRFAHFSQRSIDLVGKLDDLDKSIAIYRSVPQAKAPAKIFENIKQILEFK